jgi:Tol biopolymer transport system component
MSRIIGGAAAAALLAVAGATHAGTTTRSSVSSLGVQGNAHSQYPSLSADGRFVAFDSSSTNFHSDTNFRLDIFVHDRASGLTECVSVSSTGVEGNGSSERPSVSADGQVVAFMGSSDTLVAGDSNVAFDIFVRDRAAAETTRVSISSTGTQANFDSRAPSISADGLVVVFESGASNLVAGDSNGARDVFVHDRSTGETTRASISTEGVQGNGHSGSDALAPPRLSGDGRFVAFQSFASNLVAGDDSGSDVFIRDRLEGTTTRVSVSSLGQAGNGGSVNPSISADGRFVAFSSVASNLVAGDNNGHSDIFVHDRQTGLTRRASVSSAGVQSNAVSEWPAVSADGSTVAFWSLASNLVAGDVNGAVADVFAHVLATGITSLVSVASDGTQGNNDSREPTISASGRHVAFHSNATTLVPLDSNGVFDVFLHDRSTQVFADGFE